MNTINAELFEFRKRNQTNITQSSITINVTVCLFVTLLRVKNLTDHHETLDMFY